MSLPYRVVLIDWSNSNCSQLYCKKVREFLQLLKQKWNTKIVQKIQLLRCGNLEKNSNLCNLF